jgi:hypothetical protein
VMAVMRRSSVDLSTWLVPRCEGGGQQKSRLKGGGWLRV